MSVRKVGLTENERSCDPADGQEDAIGAGIGELMACTQQNASRRPHIST